MYTCNRSVCAVDAAVVNAAEHDNYGSLDLGVR